MVLLRILTALLAFSLPSAQLKAADQRDDLYSAMAIVTGQGVENRQPGFRDCLDRVLVRVSGDPRLPSLPAMAKLRSHAGDFVNSFSYHDRLAGRPVHDEQGTYDRPHDLTCRYDTKVIDGLLAQLGSRPWLGKRPRFAIFLAVERNGRKFRLSSDNPRDEAMREAFTAAATPLALAVAFPTTDAIGRFDMSGDAASPQLVNAARKAGGDRPLAGTLTWSDPDLGWVATWRLSENGRIYVWTVRGVNFDDAFRTALDGAAQILSGNGSP
jgi:hypothetical protein